MTVAGVAALAVGGGALLMTNNNASAARESANDARKLAAAQAPITISCPDVTIRLSNVPQQARPTVDNELAKMDSQVADAYGQLARRGGTADQEWVRTRVLDPLASQRRSALNRITVEISRVSNRPAGLESLAACTVKRDESASASNGAAPSASALAGEGQAQAGQAQPGQAQPSQAQPSQGQAGQGQAGQAQAGPNRADFVDIRTVRPNVALPAPGSNASRGTFQSRCGRNENKHFNPDNVIVAPGVSNGAHHMHDYVGNLKNDAFATNDILGAAGTTCTNGDRSSYFWPVVRLSNGKAEKDANIPGGGKDGNIGTILQPASATQTFRGSPVSKVTAIPKFLRIITGDAKAFVNGTANANASWSCTGFENRQLKDKYPLCPRGSQVVRTFNFQSCWDGQNTDSANHRTHVTFAGKNGACPQGFKAIPQLVQRITYKIAPGSLFAVDSFPEQLHKPVTDHGDFINVMSSSLMKNAVNCINTGRRCG
ncbi:DUF1996 domain-containing protein [Streptomyces sp. NBC_00829]|uniref:DUF1996 domain-containing protein n=1 Tax=Streptomyces sp. NBC_00829 TaxID=2903679 RepID=UPI00386A75A9|nr:DUF1996 domain-containing protein [Streptomyces sp. NBC_00829]